MPRQKLGGVGGSGGGLSAGTVPRGDGGQNKLCDFLFFLLFKVIMGFYGILIIPTWLINDS